jgi:hypothetical protein
MGHQLVMNQKDFKNEDSAMMLAFASMRSADLWG